MNAEGPTPSGDAAERPFALIAGGGTGGHVLPGLAVAAELVQSGHPRGSIHFVGSKRGPEAGLVPAAGFEVTLLSGRGIQRRPSVQSVVAVVGLVRAFVTSVALVLRSRPRVVLVLGGYAAAPCAFAAVLLRVPIVVADQNARAGAVNRLVSRFAAACAVPFEDTDLPKAVVTGNPVREVVLYRAANRDPAAARQLLGLPADRTVVAVFAGSLGAKRVNSAVCEAVAGPWSGRGDLAVHHVVGTRDWDSGDFDHVLQDAAGALGGRGSIVYNPVRYEEHMELVLDAADLVLCRAGGTTVAELAVMGTPAILVPLPIATRDHQRANAGELVHAGAASLLDDGAVDADSVVRHVDDLLTDPATLQSMASAARSLGRPDAARAVADLVETHAR